MHTTSKIQTTLTEMESRLESKRASAETNYQLGYVAGLEEGAKAIRSLLAEAPVAGIQGTLAQIDSRVEGKRESAQTNYQIGYASGLAQAADALRTL